MISQPLQSQQAAVLSGFCTFRAFRADELRDITERLALVEIVNITQYIKSKMERLSHVFSEKHKQLIKDEGEKERKRVNLLNLQNHNKRCKNNPVYRASVNLRSRLRAALRAKKAKKQHVGMLGCTVEELKRHLESLWLPGMSWDNYGNGGWHIDHIKPCCKFDLLDPEEQRKCFHYSNLQPLWDIDNWKKGNK